MEALTEKICIKDNDGVCCKSKRKIKINNVTIDDIKDVCKIYYKWVEICDLLEKISRRKVNFPEGISEILVAKIYGFVFLNQSSLTIDHKKISISFDCFDKKKGDKIQIKACSVEKDVTSFGPRSKFDRLIFADFYNKNYDGTFILYDISVDTIENAFVNISETVQQQANQKRRPRLSLKEIVEREKINGEMFKLNSDGTIEKIELEEN